MGAVDDGRRGGVDTKAREPSRQMVAEWLVDVYSNRPVDWEEFLEEGRV
jgi:hypothetical protein